MEQGKIFHVMDKIGCWKAREWKRHWISYQSVQLQWHLPCATIHAVTAFLLIGMLCINAAVQWKPPWKLQRKPSEKPCIRKNKSLANESSQTKAMWLLITVWKRQCLLFPLGRSSWRPSNSPYLPPFFFLFPNRKGGNIGGKLKWVQCRCHCFFQS